MTATSGRRSRHRRVRSDRGSMTLEAVFAAAIAAIVMGGFLCVQVAAKKSQRHDQTIDIGTQAIRAVFETYDSLDWTSVASRNGTVAAGGVYEPDSTTSCRSAAGGTAPDSDLVLTGTAASPKSISWSYTGNVPVETIACVYVDHDADAAVGAPTSGSWDGARKVVVTALWPKVSLPGAAATLNPTVTATQDPAVAPRVSTAGWASTSMTRIYYPQGPAATMLPSPVISMSPTP